MVFHNTSFVLMKSTFILIAFVITNQALLLASQTYSISGQLNSPFGTSISEAEVFINNISIINPNADGSFTIHSEEAIKSLTIYSFLYIPIFIECDVNNQNINLGNIYLIPKIIWSDKKKNRYLLEHIDNSKFKGKNHKNAKKERHTNQKRWIIHGKSKFYDVNGKIQTKLIYRNGMLVAIKRKNKRRWQKNKVQINDKSQIILTSGK